MADFLTVTYQHDCTPACTRQGQVVTVRPECKNGAAYLVPLICVDSHCHLREVRMESE